jgi:acyl-coenzyme A synthetase/AMP-(fatty) acid ligase
MRNSSWWGAHLLNNGRKDDLWAITRSAVTREELRAKVVELHRSFRNDGIEDGSTVALRMAPSLTLLQTLFALWACGAQVMLIDARVSRAEYHLLLNLLQPQYVLCSPDDNRPVLGFQDETGFTVQRRSSGKPGRTDICLAQFSSGSTGKPKVIGRSADSLLAELQRYLDLDGMPGNGDRLVLLNSITHTMGLISVLHCLNVGTTVIVPPSIRPLNVLRMATDAQASAIFGVPAHFDLLTRTTNSWELPSLRVAVSAGERLPLKTYEDFRGRYQVPIGSNYGMTEVGIIASDLTGASRPPAVGLPAPGIEVKLVDQELYVRIDNSPYLHGDHSGQFADGWLRTYDRCEQDPSTGVLNILGRADSLVAIGGIKVDLTEVEIALMAHPQITEAVVTYGEAIEAFVACNGLLDSDELTTWCRERLSPVKIPKLFFTASELLRNPNGKLVRNRELMHAAVRAQHPPLS